MLNDSPELYPFYAATSYIGSYVSQTRTRQLFFLEEDTSALLLCLVGPISTYPGYFLDRKGMASNSSYLQDNNYYQAFSYTVRTKSDISQYRDIVESFAHPAGMKMFGERSAEELFSLEPVIIESVITTIPNVPVGYLRAILQAVVRAEAVFPFNNGLVSEPDYEDAAVTISPTLNVVNNLSVTSNEPSSGLVIASARLNVR